MRLVFVLVWQNMKIKTFLMMTVVVAFLSIGCGIQAQEFDLERAKQGWSHAKSSLNEDLSFSTVEMFATADHGKVDWRIEAESKFQLSISNSAQICFVESGQNLLGLNPEYFFEIGRMNQEKYSIHALLPRSEYKFYLGLSKLRESTGIYCGLYVEGVEIDQLFASKKFQVSGTHLFANSTGIVVEFQAGGFEIDELNRIESGSITLQPEKNWLISNYEIVASSIDNLREFKKPGKPAKWVSTTVLAEIEYHEIAGIVVPKKSITTFRTKSNRDRRYSIQFDNYKVDRLEPNTFYLSHYGLPEPTQFPRNWSLPLIGMIAGAITFCLAIVIYRRTKFGLGR